MEHDKKKARRIKLIGLALCLLLTVATICLLALIFRYPRLLIPIGPIAVYVLYRAYFGSPAQRKQERARKAAIEADRRRWQDHRFFPVSKRGQAAYLILCLEEALKFYDSENLESWKWLLHELWQITSIQEWDIDEWSDRICDASIGSVMEYCADQKYDLSHDEMRSLRELYSKDKSFLPVIDALYDQVYLVSVLDQDVSAIDEAERILKEQGIPFPQDRQALNFIMSHRDRHYGKPFDGIPLSSIL